ncbi:hypothetical protein OHA70_39175 [Kribbella sp. NBC_00382]|uniref:hypothetical protein n=1 Tax=Kribbella sp. NBC_00382 TaxID=2975967 RepID=UPI002E1A9980
MTVLSSRRRVRLWFGQHQIGEYIGDHAYADRYEAAMRRRFPGLEITNETLAARSPSAASRQVFEVGYLTS